MTSELALEDIQKEFSSTLGAPSKYRPSLIKLAGDISTRRYYRITQGNDSFVLQVAEAFSSDNESAFLQGQQLFSKINIRVPKILDSRPAKGLILMEDLGDLLLQSQPSLNLYEEAINAIVCWTHLAHPLNPDFAHKNFLHFKLAFDFEKLNFEMNHSDVHLFQKLFQCSPGEYLRLSKHNTEYLANRPRFLCHRDYHSKNIMVSNQHIAVIDFQDARMGPISYDLVSLIWDPYAQLATETQSKLVAMWKKAVFSFDDAPFLEGLLKNALADFQQEIERMKIQRLIKAAGSYASFFNTRGRKDYLDCIPYALNEAKKSLQLLENSNPADKELLQFLSNIDLSLLEKL